MAALSTRRPLLTASDPLGATRLGRTSGISYGYPTTLGFVDSGGSAIVPTTTMQGGNAPSWMCAIIGRSSCAYTDLIGAGLGYLLGTGGGGSEPSSGNGATPGTGLTTGGAAAGCPAGQIGYPPLCFDVQPGGATQGGGMVVTQGEAVMGRYGAALQPSVSSRQVARCLPGMVLGNDGLCYNRRDIRKSDRKWVPGRKPLLTGGDLNAISKAARAASRLNTQKKRLEKLGLLKKPSSRGGARRSPGVITKAEAARALRS